MGVKINKSGIGFDMVMCVVSGDGFKKGTLYPQVGTNNGIQIQRINDEGDCVTYLYQTGGIGEGLFNNWDGTGKPSFNPYEPKLIIGRMEK